MIISLEFFDHAMYINLIHIKYYILLLQQYGIYGYFSLNMKCYLSFSWNDVSQNEYVLELDIRICLNDLY